MPGLFLTDAELQELTGRERPHAQVTVLRRNGVRFYRRADGRLRVPRAEIAPDAGAHAAAAAEEPDFDALAGRE